jgi:hypothetical protein
METNRDLHDPNNITYRPDPALYFQQEHYTDTIEDDAGNDFRISVSLEYYWDDGQRRVVKYSYKPQGLYYMTDESMDESVRESIIWTIGLNVNFECAGTKI